MKAQLDALHTAAQSISAHSIKKQETVVSTAADSTVPTMPHRTRIISLYTDMPVTSCYKTENLCLQQVQTDVTVHISPTSNS